MFEILLRLIGKIIGSVPPPAPPRDVRKVLIVDLSFIGDLVMASVVHQAVRGRLPGVEIHSMGFPVIRHILPIVPAIDALHPIPQTGMLKQVSAVWKLRAEKFDLAIHLNTGLWVNFLVWLTGAPRRLGYDYRGRGCFHNIRVPISARTVRTKFRPEECVELLEKGFGWEIRERRVSLRVDRAAEDAVREKLKAWGIAPEELLVGVHTSSRQDREIRCWEEKKYAEVANALIAKYNVKLIFTDVAADREFVTPIWDGIVEKGRIVDAMGQTDIPELCALLKRTDLFITVNTAPMHLAVAVGTPLVAILGYAPPHIYFPAGDRRFQYVVDEALKRYDPQSLVQKEPSRIREIGVEDVLEKVDYLMRHVVPAPGKRRGQGRQ